MRPIIAGIACLIIATTAVCLPASAEENHVKALGHESIGNGPLKVVVLNDWLADTSTWENAKTYLDRARFTYVFADLPGYGRSKSFSGPFDLEHSAADVLALADALHWQRFAIVGHSMSSLIALHIAQHYPERIHHAVVLTPPPPQGFGASDTVLADLRRSALADDEQRRSELNARWGTRLSEGWVAFKVAKWRASADPAAVADYARMFARAGLPDPSMPLTMPLLAITGEEDIELMRRDSVSRLLAPLAKDLTVVPFQQCSHYPMQEMPPLTVATLERFLTDARN